MIRPAELRLSILIVLLAIPVHLVGLLAPHIYRDPVVLLPQNLGTDVVTLCIGIPLLGIATGAMRVGSLRGRLLWLGALGYLVYAYGMYALGVRWTPLFLAYLTLFSLSFFALVIGLLGTDAAAVRFRAARVPVRAVAIYLIVIAVLVSAIWLKEEVGSVLSGAVPQSVREFETPTNIVHVFDLGLVLPAMTIAAVLLLRDRPWGYVLAGMLLVKASTIGLWVAVMIWFSARAGIVSPPGYTTFFLTLTVVGVALSWAFLRGIEPTSVVSGSRSSVKGLIDQFMPRADYRERHETIVRAPADVVFDVAQHFDLQSISLVRAIFWLRARLLGARPPAVDLFTQGLVVEAKSLGWGELAWQPSRELVMGATAQPWKPDVTFTAVPADQFLEFAAPDLVKIVWTLEVEPLGPARTRFRTETRVLATDDAARHKFRRYWRFFGIGIVMIRWLLLPALRRTAEQRAHA